MTNTNTCTCTISFHRLFPSSLPVLEAVLTYITNVSTEDILTCDHLLSILPDLKLNLSSPSDKVSQSKGNQLVLTYM